MSRLDWFTILIVGICVVALGFLIYKTVQLVGNENKEISRTEASTLSSSDERPGDYDHTGEAISDRISAPGTEDQDLDDDELAYDPQEVEPPVEQKEEPKKSSTATSPKSGSSADDNKKAASKPASSSSSAAQPSAIRKSSPTGSYMVVAGSFSQQLNADNQVRRLKRLGYPNAEVILINNGTLASAVVDRFNSVNDAKSLISELKRKGVDAIVKRR